MTELILYEAARRALAQAVRVDEVKNVLDRAEALRLCAHVAGDAELEANAAELRLRAERRLGPLIEEGKRTGQIKTGPKSKPKPIGTSSEPIERYSLDDLGIGKKLSARAQKVGGIAERAFEAMISRLRQQIHDRAGRVSLDLVKTEDKRARREERLESLMATAKGLPDRKFNVIYADPPWHFEPYSSESGMDRAADNHYPTMGTEAICAMDIAKIAAKDCVLFLWATVPMLKDAFDVMLAWGFVYKSHCIWNKDEVGTGYWFRNKHELLLVGVKGKIPAPLPGSQSASVIDAPVKDHSRKPIIFRAMIEALFQGLPKIELFARTPAAGWGEQWGFEAPTHDEDGVLLEGAFEDATHEEVRRGNVLSREHDALPGEEDDDVPAFLRSVATEKTADIK